MRILAALFAVLAVTVWWAPMPRLFQSLILVALAVLMLMFREAQNRLDRAHKATVEARDLLRQIRDAAAPADPQEHNHA